MKRVVLFAFLFLLGCLYSNAQTPVQIDPQVAAQHLLPSPMPIYPAIARAAHIQGIVLLLIVIDENGRVVDEAVVSGPPMLQGAAVEGVRQFTYSPFQQNGKPVEVATAVGIGFAYRSGSVSVLNNLTIDKGLKPRIEFLASYMACNRQVPQPTANSQAVELCHDAEQKAEMLPSNTDGRRAAYVAYATALLHDGKPAAAIDPGKRAISAAETTSYDPAAASAAYAVTGEALALTGNLQEADRDFSTAEKYAQKAIGATSPQSPLREQRSQTLKAMLEYHATILAKLGKQEDAKKKLKEAAKL